MGVQGNALVESLLALATPSAVVFSTYTMAMLAGIHIASSPWLGAGLGILAVAVVLLVWTYRTGPLQPAWRTFCAALKLLGALALVACLLDPLWVGERAKPGANLFLILADNSQSLQVQNPTTQTSRGNEFRPWLDGRSSEWLGALESHFQVRRYSFDSQLQPVRAFDTLDFSGRATSLHSSLRTIAQRYQGRPLAGILLFTDGNATDLPEAGPDWTGLPPLYPVTLDASAALRDVAILRTTIQQSAFEDAPVTIQAEVAAEGFPGDTVVAQLWAVPIDSRSSLQTNTVSPTKTNAVAANPTVSSTPGQPLAEQRQKAVKSQDRLAFRFQFRPVTPGISFYHLRVALADTGDTPGATASSREATLANNARYLVVDRGQGSYRILYVGGRPNWEFKFLNRALDEDDQVKLTGLIRIAKREPRFEFRGRQGETSNPLFRGFDRKGDETERYDQPVLIRFNTRDALELQGGFPATAETLFEYHAIVLDDLDAAFFTQAQLKLLYRFASERGGGVLMLGGPESFQDGGYQNTLVADLLPIYLDTPLPTSTPTGLKFTLTREGWLQPWARLHATEPEERSRLEAMPPFLSFNPARHLKPGAIPIATVTDNRGTVFPALVVQRFGHGRTAALLVADFWRWGMRDEGTREALAKAWRQLARWLVADVPSRVSLQAQTRSASDAHSVPLEVRVKTKEYQPLDNARAQVEIMPILTSTAGTATNTLPTLATSAPPATVKVPAEPSLAEPGLYETAYVPHHTGAYLAETTVLDEQSAEIGRAQAGWTSDPAAEEFASLQPNRALLETAARATRGQLVSPDELEVFVKNLPSKQAPITETWSFPLWHRAWMFLFALTCFIAEWGLRRRLGLA